MSGVVHYKFKSARAFSSVSFSGAFIKVGILKRTIAEQEGLLKSNQSLDLLLTNSQDGTGLYIPIRAPPRGRRPAPPPFPRAPGRRGPTARRGRM